jgi:hypothetical protein
MKEYQIYFNFLVLNLDTDEEYSVGLVQKFDDNSYKRPEIYSKSQP